MTWYDDAMQLRDFANALEQSEYVDGDEVLKKPYKFEDEFAIWKEHGHPDQTDSEWEDFIKALDSYAKGETD